MDIVLAVVLAIVIGTLIGIGVNLICEWNDDRVSSAEQAKEAERQRIANNALALKQRLDAEAFAARRALFEAAQRHASGSRDK